MASRAAVPFLVAMMLLTGVCNTLLTKFQDNQCVRNCDDPNPRRRVLFEQPVLQTAQMFVGELGCWLIVGLMAVFRRFVKYAPADHGYQIIRNADVTKPLNGNSESNADHGTEQSNASESTSILRGWRITLLALPAFCDICATTLMNAGLLLVAASIYQMTRGALVLFVGLFSVLFLKRHLRLFQWLSLVGVMLGVAVVGLAGAIWPDEMVQVPNSLSMSSPDADNSMSVAAKAIVGVLLIAGAQIFTATQFVLEEWILENSAVDPIKVVGWEGIFGFTVTLLIMVTLHFTIGRTEAGLHGSFDIREGWQELRTHKALWTSSILIMISIGGFNYFGLSVTRSVSATARSTIDTCRTLFIWIVSLGLKWETFKWLQIVGFSLLVYSTFVFNGVVQPPLRCLRSNETEVEELLPEEPIEHQ